MGCAHRPVNAPISYHKVAVGAIREAQVSDWRIGDANCPISRRLIASHMGERLY